MFTYYAGTQFFRAWILEDLRNQPINVEKCGAIAHIKRSPDADELIVSFETGGDADVLTLFSDSELNMSWLEWNMSELDIPPGDYVFYVYLTTPTRILLESSHLLVLANSDTEVTP